MYALKECLIPSAELAGLKTIDTVQLVRPCQYIGCDLPFETTNVGDTLRLCQQRLASPQSVLG